MNIDWIRDLCLSFPRATEEEVWTDDLTFKVAGKMFAHTPLIPARVWLSFKASPEKFAELTERPGIIPAPYLARAQWVALETRDAIPPQELAPLLRESYDMVVAKLPRKTREVLLSQKPSGRAPSSPNHGSKRSSRKPSRKKKKPSR
ncbi:MAG: MmcQ/YjbR family DNA-binding protein [Candidatus Acidiferrum sp.]